MSSFALYRMPHADCCTLVEQRGDEVQRLYSCKELSEQTGFVVAPFQISPDQPIYVIRPDVVRRMKIEPPVSGRFEVAEEKDNRQVYASDYAHFHAQLESGVFRKVVLARSVSIRLRQTVDTLQLFWQACRLYPRLFISLVALPGGDYWLTSTPEILLEGEGVSWRTMALAGTMQLKGEQLKGEGEGICWSTKNIQEQRYVATYIAGCLEKLSLSYREEGPYTVRAASLVHLRSDFTFTINNNVRAGDLLEILHPTPAVCGLPKRETFDFIVANESAPRRYYSGFMGPLGIDSATHLYVSLRCMHINGSTCRLYAGGGLLKDSIEEQEWAETEAKLDTMRNLIKTK